MRRVGGALVWLTIQQNQEVGITDLFMLTVFPQLRILTPPNHTLSYPGSIEPYKSSLYLDDPLNN